MCYKVQVVCSLILIGEIRLEARTGYRNGSLSCDRDLNFAKG